MVEIIGWVGSIMLALSAFPQALASYRTKSSEGLDASFLALWFFGMLWTLIYCLFAVKSLPLIANYLVNLFLLSIIIYYKLFPAKGKK